MDFFLGAGRWAAPLPSLKGAGVARKASHDARCASWSDAEAAQSNRRLRLDRRVAEEGEMQKPLLDPPVADTAPDATVLTAYDEDHLVTYLRLLDADSEGADWQEVARLVLHIDPVCASGSGRAERGKAI